MHCGGKWITKIIIFHVQEVRNYDGATIFGLDNSLNCCIEALTNTSNISIEAITGKSYTIIHNKAKHYFT